MRRDGKSSEAREAARSTLCQALAARYPLARADVEAYYRAGGRGWQSRINAALRKAAKLPEKKRQGVGTK